VQASNRCKLLSSKAMVVSVAVNALAASYSRVIPPSSSCAIEASLAGSQNRRSEVRPIAPALSSIPSAKLIFGRLAAIWKLNSRPSLVATANRTGSPGGSHWYWGLNGVQNGPGPFSGFVPQRALRATGLKLEA
jgi:hypothetical protein